MHMCFLIGGLMLPCHNCLVLASCIGRVTHKRYVDKSNIYSIIVKVLCPLCCNLMEYIKPHEYYDYSLEHRKETIEFFMKKVIGDVY